MGNNKIVYYGETLIDLTGDTVEAAKLLKGVTAYDKKGEKITGTLADVTQAPPAIEVDAAGKITASATQAAGVVAAGTKSATKQLPVQAAKTVTPSASTQTAVAKGVFTTGIITVAAVYAVIGVTYPSGSKCTCTNGSTTLTAKDTSGKALFIIKAKGTWTVKAVSGSESASKAVSITADGQVENVVLKYGFYLFKNGDGIDSSISLTFPVVGKTLTNSGLPYTSGSLSVTKTSIVYAEHSSGENIFTAAAKDVSDFNTLYIDLLCKSRYETAASVTFGIGTDKMVYGNDGNFLAAKSGIYNTTRATYPLDISNINQAVYIKFKAWHVSYELYNWWLR